MNRIKTFNLLAGCFMAGVLFDRDIYPLYSHAPAPSPVSSGVPDNARTATFPNPANNGTVTVSVNAATSEVSTTYLNGEHKLDRPDGPALYKKSLTTGIVTFEEWWQDGQLNRVGQPAVIMRDGVSGATIGQLWYLHGREVPPGRMASLPQPFIG